MLNDVDVIILGAGLGTGLRPLSVERPKVLASVCNRSLLRHTLVQLSAGGLTRGTLVLRNNFKASTENIRGEVPDGFDLRLCYAPDSASGTVDSVRSVPRIDTRSLLIIYGDSLIAVDFKALVAAHGEQTHRGGEGTILYHRPTDLRHAGKEGRTYHGVMSVDRDGRVTRFIEKPPVSDVREGFDLANAAVFVLERKLLFGSLFESAKDFSFDIFEPACRDGLARFFGFDIGSGFRLDVGSLKRLFDANMDVLSGQLHLCMPGSEIAPGIRLDQDVNCDLAQLRPPVLLGRGVRIGRDSCIGPDVVIGNHTVVGDGSYICRAVLMEGNRVGSHARIESSIIGPFAIIADSVCVPPHSVLGAYSITGGCVIK